MKRRLLLSASVLLLPLSVLAADNQVLGWNNLGMHCMDSDYSVFSILPPYNTIQAQLIVGGKLVTTGAGYTITYEAVADADGSFNSTSEGKGNYYAYVEPIYGVALAPDVGLVGWNMPGTNNTPQSMLFEQTNQPAPVAHPGVLTPVNWWRAEGIPLTPYDDAHQKNPYPLMRIIAHSGGTPIATNDIVLPVSDEMDCRVCHASGTQNAARPAAGWAWSGNPERDYRLNILRLHDEHQFAEHAVLYSEALAARGFNPQGLYRGVVADNQPVLCAACHESEALGTPSFGTIPQLTTSVHSYHAHVIDPVKSMTLDSSANRSACYRCHPGSSTKCLRGAMGGAIAADGTMEMQCQSCHGNMSNVGSAGRIGWFEEPNCQGCHTGTATSNNGQIRYTSVFTDTNWTVRLPVNQTFATTSNTPASGLFLYRFSIGHGGLQCSACHGSTHAEFPSIHANDNVRNINIQGHAGVMVECTSCHTSMAVNSSTASGGPHGMHPIGSTWVSEHHDFIGSLNNCRACHGTDLHGTVLSRSQSDKVLVTSFDGGVRVTNILFRGAMVGCYNCHRGSGSSSPITTAPPTVSVVSGNTDNATPLSLPVAVTPASATLRIISLPSNGSLGISNNVLTYFPEAGFLGVETFAYAAWNGTNNSLLATGTVNVAQGPFSIGVVAYAPSNAPAGWPVAFTAVPSATNYSGPENFSWNFGDGSASVTNQFPSHTFTSSGTYSWNVTATASNLVANAGGSIEITDPVALSLQATNGQLAIAWPANNASAILEESAGLGADAHWAAVTNPAVLNGDFLNVNVQPDGTKFFRVRQAW